MPEAVNADRYEKWLNAKATIHARRDRKRGYLGATRSKYKESIHAAVIASNGVDYYTGEVLSWHQIGTYNNAESRSGRHRYKAGFALLPTVDHYELGESQLTFRICGWRTNDAKNDLAYDDFIELCTKVLKHAGFSVSPGA